MDGILGSEPGPREMKLQVLCMPVEPGILLTQNTERMKWLLLGKKHSGILMHVCSRCTAEIFLVILAFVQWRGEKNSIRSAFCFGRRMLASTQTLDRNCRIFLFLC